MKWFIPREHGAWAMLVVPYLIGTVVSGPTWNHLVFFIGVLSFYFASSAILSYIRKPSLGKQVLPSLLVYTLIGCLFVVSYLIQQPTLIVLGLLIIPLFVINLIFAKQKKERLFINDAVAIASFSFLVLISYDLGTGQLDTHAYILMFVNYLFFIASVFHVKTFIRERGNKRFTLVSYGYHGGIVLIPLVIGYPLIALAFLTSACKTWVMPKKAKPKPAILGIIEMANSLAFVLIITSL
ncbi:YwiC-like family protein [Desertibacillus haloalkaliphilus]|uniref:YwiC-like family protein n=1 Tax=Desertibacillus haloalkaliphilus TaxID=1328930 RepID=UPI001C254AFE|nr:YwiC-like family protein [Desertibacillus haloalkaliphilus]